ncbi:MAG TPA: sortase [Candidatus Limnocylindrales bacterium]
MKRIGTWIGDRVAPAILVAAGLALVAAGLVVLDGPVEAGGTAVASDVPVVLPTETPSASPSPGESTAGTAGPESTASPDPHHVATRVVIPALSIDLPVVRPPGGPDAYPLCNVAMFIQQLHQPGQDAATYIYAHARQGMFLSLLTESQQNDGAGMIGMLVQVYTSDDRLYLYEVSQVRRHQLDLDAALAATTEQLWLQTSEGPRGTVAKLQVVASFLGVGPADDAAAHPVPHPVVCG